MRLYIRRTGEAVEIGHDHPVLAKGAALAVQPSDLDDLYAAAAECDRTDLFFVLLASIHHYESSHDAAEAAHLNFLAAYYLFVALTPPGSSDLALHYIDRAIALDRLPLYDEWRALILKGN